MQKSNLCWEFYLDKVENSNLSDSETKSATGGLETLRKILGKQFLKNGYKVSHPLIRELLISTPENLLKIGELGHNLKAISKLSGFNRVKKEVIHPKMFIGAEAEVTVMGRFMSQGKEVEILDIGRDSIIRPDFKAVIIERWIIFEVSTSQEAQISQKSTRMSLKLGDINATNSKGENFFVEIDVTHLSPDKAEVLFDQINNRIQEIIEKSQEFTGNLLKDIYVEIKKSEFPFVHPKGPRFCMNELGRLLQKIKDKLKKFSGNQPWILWIVAQYLDYGNEKQLKQISNALISGIQRFQNLSAIVITTLKGPPKKLDFHDDKNVFFKQNNLYGNTFQESLLFIRNLKARISLTNIEINEIISLYLS